VLEALLVASTLPLLLPLLAVLLLLTAAAAGRAGWRDGRVGGR